MVVFEFLNDSQGKTLSGLADGLNESHATVYRILVTLEGRDLAEFDQTEQVTTAQAPTPFYSAPRSKARRTRLRVLPLL